MRSSTAQRDVIQGLPAYLGRVWRLALVEESKHNSLGISLTVQFDLLVVTVLVSVSDDISYGLIKG
ncbi:MAG TPA: hypothetical protein VK578_00800 [Edaphobacter sp.]|nr:hypothetical protein [Edaphobacter sp.]